MPVLDIVVPTHGKLELAITCLNALYANTSVPFHLIVVDDSNPDEDLTPEYFKRLQKQQSNLTYIHSEEPYKCGNQTFNIAISKMTTPFLATVVNSVRVEPDWETVALQLMKDDSKLGIIGFKNLLLNGHIESAGIVMLGYTPIDCGLDFPGHRLCNVYEVPAVQWSFALHRKEAIMGNLDEHIYHGFLGWDDVDNCFVVRSKGWKIVYCGMGAGYHATRATRSNGSVEALRKNQENARTFYKRWGYWEQFVKTTGYKEGHGNLSTGT